jgi:hypothetical protein
VVERQYLAKKIVRAYVQTILNSVARFFVKKRLRLRFGSVFLFRSFALIGRAQLVELYGRIGRFESRENQETPLNKPYLNRRVANPYSVAFLNNSYYNFYYLASALRDRGWDSLSVSLEDPNGSHAQFYHGNDLCLYDASDQRMRGNINAFFAETLDRFRMVHFYGRGHMAFSASDVDSGEHFSLLPLEFIRLKQNGIKIGYSVCGCLDGVSQSSFNRWSQGCCDRCVWQNNLAVCNDKRNLSWGTKIEMFCDLICCEGFPALDYQSGPKAYREPLTTALDSDFWRPDLKIPDHLRLPRKDGELIVYHAVGNFELRSDGERNVKGTRAVIEAIKRLQFEGRNVRLEFVTNMPSTDVRFVQLQADVVVDQLNHGRYGANAREAMMLGRPTICHINKWELPGETILESIDSCPLVSANEATVYDVLRDLLGDKEKRARIGAESRKFALKWHSAKSCAARFEEVFDKMMMHVPPSLKEGWPQKPGRR